MRKKKRKELALSAKKEKLAHQLEEVGGLWADEVAAIKQLALCISEKEKSAALKTQLTLRQKVLGCNCEKTLFYLFPKGNTKSSTELLSNLLKIISMSLSNVVIPIQNNYNLPVIIDEDKFQEEKVKLCCGKRNSHQLVPVQAKKKKGTRKVSVPVISCADDLVGKLVEHFCFIDNEDAEEEEDWHKSTALERHGKSSFLTRYNELQDKKFFFT